MITRPVLPQLILALLLDEGDPFLVEEYTYSHILESVAEPKGYLPVGVPMDRHGVRPDALRQARGHDPWAPVPAPASFLAALRLLRIKSFSSVDSPQPSAIFLDHRSLWGNYLTITWATHLTTT